MKTKRIDWMVVLEIAALVSSFVSIGVAVAFWLTI